MITLIPDYQDTPAGKHPTWQHINDSLRNAIYVHGQLNRIAGFDIVYCLPDATNTTFVLPDDDAGIMQIKVVTHKGQRIEHDAELIWWICEQKTHKWIRGLIVLPSDTPSKEYALRKQKERSPML